MEKDVIIDVSHVSKAFNTLGRSTTLKDFIVYRERRKKDKREVIKNISFTVKKGEMLGIIGRNGSGKSTILKLLTKILYPDEGKITVSGKIASLIELGAGFHPDMTGRENVYINASILGLTNYEIDEKMNKIIEFSGLEKYIDERIRNYSSGMYLRLAFSVAINVEADVLLIDEILAVGDLKFQNKCLNKLKEFRENGGTVVMVTHNLDQATQMCNDVLWIEKGSIQEYGNPADVCYHYFKFMTEEEIN